jgi:hypothetical protein
MLEKTLSSSNYFYSSEKIAEFMCEPEEEGTENVECIFKTIPLFNSDLKLSYKSTI